MAVLGPGDLDVLGRIHVGETSVSSHHLVRLELRGLVKDTTSGMQLTPAGLRALRSGHSLEPETIPGRDPGRDALGRRLGRRSPNSRRDMPY
jgi:hypothetical protein